MSSLRPHVFRITKYDPAHRDDRGVYIGAEESVSDHGPVEAAYPPGGGRVRRGQRRAAALHPEEGLVELVREDQDGRITGTIADEEQYEDLAAVVRGARSAAAMSMCVDQRIPLFTAVLPDADGIVRARWRTEPAPGDRALDFLRTLHCGQVVTGVVTGIADLGVTFVDIGGFTAMINIPELSWRFVSHPSEIVTVGQRVTAEILDVDLVRERVPLSLRALQPDPMRQIARHVGETVTGEVTKLLAFGVFVRIEDRADGYKGLLHNTELGRPPGGRGPGEAVQVGDRRPVKIIDVDLVRRRILLSHTQAHSAGAQEGRENRPK